MGDGFARVPKGRMLKCEGHGEVEWEGHVCCAACERVYQTSDVKAPHYAQLVCDCGLRLMPAKATGGKGVDFTARSICPGCYALRVAS